MEAIEAVERGREVIVDTDHHDELQDGVQLHHPVHMTEGGDSKV